MTCSECTSTATTTCVWCDTPLCDTHIQLGQPFISARQLVTITATTAFRTPALLGDILLKELPKVPYCVKCRLRVVGKRQAEQFKFVLSLLLIVSLMVGLLYFQFAG
jgi:hypothetical protein